MSITPQHLAHAVWDDAISHVPLGPAAEGFSEDSWATAPVEVQCRAHFLNVGCHCLSVIPLSFRLLSAVNYVIFCIYFQYPIALYENIHASNESAHRRS
jgi:hypothetical protein